MALIVIFSKDLLSDVVRCLLVDLLLNEFLTCKKRLQDTDETLKIHILHQIFLDC